MAKTWLIAQHHFMQEVRKRTFIIVLFSLPLFLAVSIGAGYVAVRLQEKSTTLGYVDPAGLLVDTSAEPAGADVRLVPYATAQDALQALKAAKIDAYYLLPDAPNARRAQLIYLEPPDYKATRYFEDLVRRNRMADQPPALVERVLSGADVTVRASERNRDFPDGEPSAAHVLPLMAAAIYAFLVLTTFGYMAEAVVVEKENRTMEIIVSSVSPGRLMAGKILGALGIALMQLVVWVACLVLAIWLGGHVLEIDWLRDIQPNWRDIGMIVIVALPTYLFMGALTTMIGSTMVDNQEAQQLGGLAFMVLFLPVYLVVALIQNPNGLLALAFSLFPPTAVVTIAMRSLLFEVPAWQIALSASVALACGVGAVWLAGKAFRLSMLRYGQRLRLRDLLARRSRSKPVRPARV
jgi:ABC-2 type transport system permease protein